MIASNKWARSTIYLENQEIIPDFEVSNKTACAFTSPPKEK